MSDSIIVWCGNASLFLIFGTIDQLFSEPSHAAALNNSENRDVLHIQAGNIVESRDYGTGRVLAAKNGKAMVCFAGTLRMLHVPQAIQGGTLKRI